MQASVDIMGCLGSPIGAVSNVAVVPLMLPRDGSYSPDVANKAVVRRVLVRFARGQPKPKGLRAGSILAIGGKSGFAIASVTGVALESIHADIVGVWKFGATNDLFITNWQGVLINEQLLPKLEGGRAYWIKNEVRGLLDKARSRR